MSLCSFSDRDIIRGVSYLLSHESQWCNRGGAPNGEMKAVAVDNLFIRNTGLLLCTLSPFALLALKKKNKSVSDLRKDNKAPFHILQIGGHFAHRSRCVPIS